LGALLNRRQRVERQSGGIHTDFVAYRLMPKRLAHQRKDERLRDAHDCEIVLGVADRKDLAIGAHHADAEQFWRHSGERGIDLLVMAIGIRLKAPMALEDKLAHLVWRGQVASRNVRLAHGSAAHRSLLTN